MPSPVILLDETSVSVYTRLYSGRAMEGKQKCCIRLACSGINTSEIKEGLGKFKASVEG